MTRSPAEEMKGILARSNTSASKASSSLTAAASRGAVTMSSSPSIATIRTRPSWTARTWNWGTIGRIGRASSSDRAVHGLRAVIIVGPPC